MNGSNTRHKIRLEFRRCVVRTLGTKYDLNLEGAWFEPRHKIRLDFRRCMVRASAQNTTSIWKVRGSNTRHKIRLQFGRCDKRPCHNPLQSHAAPRPHQCTHGTLYWASATPFYIHSNSLLNIILSLSALTEGDHILATNVGQPPQNFWRQKGDMTQSQVQ